MEEPRSGTVPRAATMKAVVQTRYGTNPTEIVKSAELPIPRPQVDEVLIRVAASSINALDWRYLTGTPYFLRLENGLRTPRRQVPGADVAGVVVEVGSEVTEFKTGDEVFGEIGGGGFAEYAIAKARYLAHRPRSLPLDETATLGVAALTALQALRDWGGMTPGDRVIINGASGGVGSFAIQIALALGASHVTAVCSTANVATAIALGAHRVIDYTVEDFSELDDRFDVFFDNAGSKSLNRSRRLLAAEGTMVMVTGKIGKWIRPVDRLLAGMILSRFWSQRFANGVAAASGTDGTFLAQLVDEGKLRPAIDRRFTLDEAVEALAYQGAGHARGKSIVTVA